MLTNDVQTVDGIPAIVIQTNKYRGIKGEPENAREEDKLTRVVPIHSQLIDLGFLDYVEAARSHNHPLLFPDIVPKPRKASAKSEFEDRALLVEKFGERYDDIWRKSLNIALDGNPRELCLHSLRHFVNNVLLHANAIQDVTRYDLLGHLDVTEKQNTNSSTYRDETDMAIKRAAIETLPRLM